MQNKYGEVTDKFGAEVEVVEKETSAGPGQSKNVIRKEKRAKSGAEVEVVKKETRYGPGQSKNESWKEKSIKDKTLYVYNFFHRTLYKIVDL